LRGPALKVARRTTWAGKWSGLPLLISHRQIRIRDKARPAIEQFLQVPQDFHKKICAGPVDFASSMGI
jgi:hypothetical protein